LDSLERGTRPVGEAVFPQKRKRGPQRKKKGQHILMCWTESVKGAKKKELKVFIRRRDVLI